MSTITYFSASLCVSTERVTVLLGEPEGGAKALQRRTALQFICPFVFVCAFE